MNFLLLIASGFIICVAEQAKSRHQQKRILLHSDEDVSSLIQLLSEKVEQQELSIAQQDQRIAQQEQQIAQQDQRIAEQDQRIAFLETGKHAKNESGSVYVRWGRTVCPGNGTELLYKGFTAGSHYLTTGGAADYICLTDDPEWGAFDDSNQTNAPRVYGTEYQFHQYNNGATAFFGQDLSEHDAPCALCHTKRSVVVMIPGRKSCYNGWTIEYWGYLVGGTTASKAASNYACLDYRAEVEFGDLENRDGKLMHLTEAECGALKCPPYIQGREITCVVCSK